MLRKKKFSVVVMLWAVLISTSTFAIDSSRLTAIHRFEGPVVVRVYYNNQDELQALADSLDVWHVNQKQQFAWVQLSDVHAFDHALQLGLPMHVDAKQTESVHLGTLKSEAVVQGGQTIPGFSCYSTVEHSYTRMQQLVTDHPDLAEVVDIGESWEKENLNAGYDLKILKITNQNTGGNKPVFFAASAIHSREYATAELNMRFAELLVSSYGVDPDVTWILDHHEVHLQIQANPDGRKEAETGLYWRKNKNNNHCANSNTLGVDLNRNFPFGWGYTGDECTEVYAGVGGESEPETAAQLAYLRSVFADQRPDDMTTPAPDDASGIYLDIHSYGGLVLWPWGISNNSAPNASQLEALGKSVAQYTSYTPQSVADLYLTPGGSIDTAYGEFGVAALAFELGTEFFQDCGSFESTVLPDNLEALKYMARVAGQPYIEPLGPIVEDLHVIPNVIVAGTDIEVSGVAQDDHYNHQNGSQTLQPIASVAAYLGSHPASGGQAIALAAKDGSFNDTVEGFSGTVQASQLAQGKQLLYVQASDTQGPGATYAQFVEVTDASSAAQLYGQVRDAGTGQSIPNAVLSINQSFAASKADGSYQQWVMPGTHDLSVEAAGYSTHTIDDIQLTAGSAQQFDVWLQPFCDLAADDFEAGVGQWNAEGDWALSNESSVSGTHAWTTAPFSNYGNNLNISLTSPVYDLSGVDDLSLNYQSRCETEAGYDYGYTEIRFDGGSWQAVNQCDNESTWGAVNLPLSLPAQANNIQVRFRLSTDQSVNASGWFVDDFELTASGDVCGGFNFDLIFADDFE